MSGGTPTGITSARRSAWRPLAISIEILATASMSIWSRARSWGGWTIMQTSRFNRLYNRYVAMAQACPRAYRWSAGLLLGLVLLDPLPRVSSGELLVSVRHA